MIYTEYETLCGHTDFRSFEDEYDDFIFYADGLSETVTRMVEEECEFSDYIDTDEFHLIYFDGWFIAIWQMYGGDRFPLY